MNKKNTLLLIIGILLFGSMSTLLLVDKVKYIDDFIYKIVTIGKNDNITYLFKYITFFGSAIGITFILLVQLIFSKKKLYVLLNGLLGIISLIINSLIKILVDRGRPIGINLINERYSSFPSGHSMCSFTIYSLMIYMIWSSKINKNIKIVYTFILSLLIISIGMSRIYLGVHYASDVLAGWGLGLIVFSIYIPFFNKIISMKKRS